MKYPWRLKEAILRLKKAFFFFFPPDVTNSHSNHNSPLSSTGPLLVCLDSRYWMLGWVHFVQCHLLWGITDALCLVAWLWWWHVWATLCYDYVWWTPCLLIRLWEGTCLWIIAHLERKKREEGGKRKNWDEEHMKKKRKKKNRRKRRERQGER